MKPLTFWDRLARAVRDRSFVVGSALVTLFVLVAVLGPEVAPHNPFMRDRVQTIDGELMSAPIPPCDVYPIGTDGQGRDMLSLLLHGARQTLVIAFVAMVVRLMIGLFLGTVAGWWPGSWFDRVVMAVTEFMAAIPALILAVLLVYAIGIRRGQVTFIAALSLVGWGEVAQIVRGHVLGIRNRLFILASRAVGLGSAEILSRHVLPNLLSTLLAMAALEMGGILLLQGELGFLHIFIGGGGLFQSDAVGTVLYFEIPDWGAMLGTSWGYFRALPWLPLAPALAFFISILGFNLFGYGLQRFIEKGRFHPSGWSVLRFFAVMAVLLLGARSLLAGSSLEAQFVDLAAQFNLQRAWNDVSFLTQPQLQGRPSGPGGGYTAAGYIAQQYEALNLTPLPVGGYYQSYPVEVGRVTVPPVLSVGSGGEGVEFQFEQDFIFDPGWSFVSEVSNDGELVIVANQPERRSVIEEPGDVIFLLDPSEDPPGLSYLSELRHAGVLRLVTEEDLPHGVLPEPPLELSFSYRSGSAYPGFLIRESSARRMLEAAGYDLDELRERWATGEEIVEHTGLQVHVEAGLAYEEVTGVNVIGYLPAADIQTQGERIMVATSYTGPPPQGDVYYPGADVNASGVAIMLEVARLWRDLGFEPKRTVVFVALDSDGGHYFVNRPSLPTSVGDAWTVVMLEGLGAGEVRISRQELGLGLASTFDDSARRFDVRTEMLEDYRFFFVNYGSTYQRGRQHEAYSGVALTRLGDDLSGTSLDTLDHIDPQLLGEAGQIVAHYLMVLANR